MSKAANDVLRERTRQQVEEGWNLEHDDSHDPGELAKAAACYALNAASMSHVEEDKYAELSTMPLIWPWVEKWWKPKNRRRDLVRAAALIIAEVEKIDRQNGEGS